VPRDPYPLGFSLDNAGRIVDPLVEDVRRIRQHVDGCAAPFVDKECACPPERLYVPLDAVVEALKKHYRENTVCSDFKKAIDVVQQAFGGDVAAPPRNQVSREEKP
jgi:hypothetical protein